MIHPAIAWLIAGSVLCLMEVVFPTAFVAFLMGFSAILVAIVALVMPSSELQVFLWLCLSTILILLSRRWLRTKSRHSLIRDAQEGETLTDISPGKAGRILYEGSSWRARCEDDAIAISPHKKVYIVGRQGNTLIVLPEASEL